MTARYVKLRDRGGNAAAMDSILFGEGPAKGPLQLMSGGGSV